MRTRHHDNVVRITNAPQAPADELARRQRRYLISMAIRTACVIAAAVFHDSWFVWAFLAGAVFLPYVAVVMANAQDRRPSQDLRPSTSPHQELE